FTSRTRSMRTRGRLLAGVLTPRPMAAKKATKRAPARRRTPRKAKAESTGLEARDCLFGEVPGDLRALVDRIEREGGALVGAYRDPFGGHPLALAVLPLA